MARYRAASSVNSAVSYAGADLASPPAARESASAANCRSGRSTRRCTRYQPKRTKTAVAPSQSRMSGVAISAGSAPETNTVAVPTSRTALDVTNPSSNRSRTRSVDHLFTRRASGRAGDDALNSRRTWRGHGAGVQRAGPRREGGRRDASPPRRARLRDADVDALRRAVDERRGRHRSTIIGVVTACVGFLRGGELP